MDFILRLSLPEAVSLDLRLKVSLLGVLQNALSCF